MPKPVSIAGRSSSITNSFINSIIPVINPTESEILNALRVLKISPKRVTCAYCGDMATEWDHLRPLVENQKPTGYISEIGNLVPSCGKCNQSKGNKHWRKWIESNAPQSPKTRGIRDLKQKIECLRKYERVLPVNKLDFEKIVGRELWEKHWQNWKQVIDEMKRSQALAAQIRSIIQEKHSR